MYNVSQNVNHLIPVLSRAQPYTELHLLSFRLGQLTNAHVYFVHIELWETLVNIGRQTHHTACFTWNFTSFIFISCRKMFTRFMPFGKKRSVFRQRTIVLDSPSHLVNTISNHIISWLLEGNNKAENAEIHFSLPSSPIWKREIENFPGIFLLWYKDINKEKISFLLPLHFFLFLFLCV